MKPTLQFLLGLALILITTSCKSASSEALGQLRETQFPAFEEIYTHVNRHIKGPGKECQFGLAKKADGYYLKITPYDKYGEFKEPKFVKAWDATTKKYLPLAIEKYYTPDYSNSLYDQGLAGVRTAGRNFELNYFYGYPNYTTDLINLLKDQEDLTSKELEMLGRAYSAEACDYIHPNQAGNMIAATEDLSDPMYEKLPTNRISAFNELAEKSLACFQKLKEKDPNYKTTIIEDLNLKIGHDLMNYYLLLRSVQENSAAEAMLKRTEYKADAIAYAKELLDNCAQNGVLMTSGDTDTFPLWYVQEKLHYRSDVIVINHSLLQAPWYFDYLKHTTSIKSLLNIKEYQYYYKNYIVLKDIDSTALTYPEWLSELRTDKDKKGSNEQEMTWMNFPEVSKNLLIDIQGTAVSVETRQSYLAGVNLCMLDLINSNKERRFYTTSVYVFSENNLEEHLVKRDLVYELLPVKATGNWDKESNRMLAQSLQKYPLKITSGKLNDIDKGFVYAKCFDWILMPEDEIETNKAVFDQFIKQLPFKTVSESENPEVPELYTVALFHMKSKKVGQFLDFYAPKALALMAGIDDQKTLSEKDAETLEGIHSCYIDRKNAYNRYATQQIDSELQSRVVKALTSKITILLDNPLNTRNLSWSLEKLERMKNGY
ncbi:hypothetical protein [Fluviicola sp.]|uniref:hypothetical protein n=1 Tax=Fluviicola sp. TaxID=1917219 RepID=UPI0031CF6943